MGREFDISHVFTKCNASDFWDGYQPMSMPIMHISELGSESPAMAKTTGSPIMQTVLSLVDNQPCPLNYSAVEDKGKNFAIPEFVVIDTNNDEFNARILNTDPSAVMRRFRFLDVSSLPEFRKENSVSIDPRKSLEQGGDLLDRYQFHFYEKVPVGGTKYRKTRS